MATKKQNRRTQVRRMRRVLNTNVDDGVTKLRMGIHRTGYRGGLSKRDLSRHVQSCEDDGTVQL